MTRLQRLWLLASDVDPALPWACLPILVWLANWALRRTAWGSRAWEWFASKGPLGTKLRKLWQAIPSAVGGTVLVSVSFDWNTTDLCIASLVSLTASVWHELLRAVTTWVHRRFPWIPIYYGGIWPAAGQSLSPGPPDSPTLPPPPDP